MPIKPKNKAQYSPDWPMIRRRILKRVGRRCEECGIASYEAEHQKYTQARALDMQGGQLLLFGERPWHSGLDA